MADTSPQTVPAAFELLAAVTLWSQLKTLKVKTLTIFNLTVTFTAFTFYNCKHSWDCLFLEIRSPNGFVLCVYFVFCLCLWLETEQQHSVGCGWVLPSFDIGKHNFITTTTTATTSCMMRLARTLCTVLSRTYQRNVNSSAHADQTYNLVYAWHHLKGIMQLTIFFTIKIVV